MSQKRGFLLNSSRIRQESPGLGHKAEKFHIRKRRQKVNKASLDVCRVAVQLHQFVGSLYLLQPLICPGMGDEKNRREPASRLQYLEHSHQLRRIIDVRRAMNGRQEVRRAVDGSERAPGPELRPGVDNSRQGSRSWYCRRNGFSPPAIPSRLRFRLPLSSVVNREIRDGIGDDAVDLFGHACGRSFAARPRCALPVFVVSRRSKRRPKSS